VACCVMVLHMQPSTAGAFGRRVRRARLKVVSQKVGEAQHKANVAGRDGQQRECLRARAARIPIPCCDSNQPLFTGSALSVELIVMR